VENMTAEYFDGWFADIDRSAARQALFTDYLGLPPEVGPSNLVPLIGLQEIAIALDLEPGKVLVDLACGRGGPGMWLARELDTALIGVDFSAEAIRQATARRALFGLADTARFAVGTLDSPGLPAGVADGAVCVDAFQFSSDPTTAANELRRLLRPGAPAVLTCWEPVDREDDAVSERIRRVDLAGWLAVAGFVDVVRQEKPHWHEVARELWEAALTVPAGEDQALVSTRAEAERSLVTHDRVRRVMVTATTP
jgi:ubiquinone/menaquinone biosynthesis C-methylase UbiE